MATTFVTYADNVKTLKTVSETQTILNVEDGATAAGATGDAHAALTGNPHGTEVADIDGLSATLGSLATADAQYYVAAVNALLPNAVVLTDPLVAADVGANNGVAGLDAGGKVPLAQLPAFDGAVSSVFGRIGDVVAATNDYTAAQIQETSTAKIMTGDERTKLAGIETGATADQTGAEIVTALNAELGGTEWQTGGGGTGAVNSVFGRTGAVTAQPGDYTATQVGAAPVREAQVSTVTSGGSEIGLNSSVILWAGGTASKALTTDTSVAKLTVSNIGTGTLTITGFNGGPLDLPVRTNATTPSSACFARSSANQEWYMV